MMNNNILKLILVGTIGFSAMNFNTLTIQAQQAPVVYIDETTGNEYKIIQDDEDERIVEYKENDIEGTVTFDKKQKTLNVLTISSEGTTSISFDLDAPIPYSVFSPWGYSKSGNNYTMTAFINGKTESKTRAKIGVNAGWIDSFCNAVDEIVSLEWGIVGSVGIEVLMAILTGGISAVASILAVAGLYGEGVALNNAMNRAKNAYLNIK